MDKAETVEEYLASVPPEIRATLERLQQMIRSTVPDAVEVISYGVPAFKYRGRPLVSIGAGKNHCSFYVQSPAVMEAYAADLDGYDTSKGTIRLPVGKSLPAALVKKLVKARIAEVEAATKK
jgi:uncharacterized protein YdhG (YjbR/CyaY superfamily)